MIKHGSINEIATVTGFPPTRIRRLIKSGDIPAVRVGAKFIVTVDAVEGWLRGGHNDQTNGAKVQEGQT